MGEYLNEQGYTCLGVRLPGHATNPKDMIRSRYTDWMGSVEDGYFLLRGISDNVFLIGLSMGGVLSLLMSTRLDVKGVVAMSTPYKLRDDPRSVILESISGSQPYIAKSNGPLGSGWFDKNAWKDHVSYPQNPVRSIGELNKLLTELQEALPDVNVPALLIHSKDDAYVVPDNLEMIYAGLKNAPDKTKMYITRSGHVITRDAARHKVFESALEFIRRVEGQFES